MLGRDPNDDLSLGKKYFRSANFGLAEKHFRRAVELHPRDAEAWVGLAASYDRLKRFDLADRAYAQAASIIGETPEIMNNQGFSYMLRGDYVRARRTLEAAQAKAPDNPYIQNNLELLEKVQRRGKSSDCTAPSPRSSATLQAAPRQLPYAAGHLSRIAGLADDGSGKGRRHAASVQAISVRSRGRREGSEPASRTTTIASRRPRC